MTARGVVLLEDWMAENVTTDPVDASILAAKFVADGAVSGFTLTDMVLDEATVEDYVRDAIMHVSQE